MTDADTPAASKDAAPVEQSSVDRTCNENLQVATAFLEEAARYFENRPTNGEDRAHWANVQNAENCRKVAAHVATLTAKLEAERAKSGVVTEDMVTAALNARVPGGAEVWNWLPQADAWTPHQTARDVIRAALEVALTRETARADAAEKFIRTISESPFAPFRVQNACAAYLLDASEKRATKTDGGAT